MIARAASGLAFIWMCIALHPGLEPSATADTCAGQACTRVSAKNTQEALLQRLREVREEIRQSQDGPETPGSGGSGNGEVALQKGDLPRLVAHLSSMVNVLLAER